MYDSSTSTSLPTSGESGGIIPLRMIKKHRTETRYDPNLTDFLIELDDFDKLNEYVICHLLREDDPKTIEEIMNSVDAGFWKEAINNELESINHNETWELVDMRRGCKLISCKWIFKRKLRTNGSIESFKARLVVEGFTQKYGLDYFYTYLLVTKIAIVRALIGLVSTHKMIVHQIDVKTVLFEWQS